MEYAVDMEPRTLADDMDEDLDVCRECTGTWKVACYGAWCPNSQFWDDFLEDGWEDSAYSPRACCLRMMCGILFWFFAPLWCCKAILFVLFWPCVCCCRAIKEGNCNRRYFKIRRSKNSQPLAYIESAHPTHPNEISYQFSAPRGLPPESPIPEIRIETEMDNGTYVSSPVDDSDIELQLPINGHRQLPTITITSEQEHDHQVASIDSSNGHSSTGNGHPVPNGVSLPSHPLPPSSPDGYNDSPNGRYTPPSLSSLEMRMRPEEDDPPPPYPLTESPGGARTARHYTTHTSTSSQASSIEQSSTSRHRSSSSPTSPTSLSSSFPTTDTNHATAKKTITSKAKEMDNNLYKAVVLEGITGKVTSV